MKSLAVLQDKSLEIVDVRIPAINDYQALVKIKACGVCNGTDIKLVHHAFKGFTTYPALLGHEGTGEVVQIGCKVKNLHIGDMVLLPFADAKADAFYSGWGAYSEFGVVGDAKALIDDGLRDSALFQECYYAQTVVPKTINAVDATMIITFREVLSAIKRFGIKTNQNVVVLGAGPVGLTFIKLLKARGNTVVAFDVTDDKAKKAADFGADFAYNSTNCDSKQKVGGIFPIGADFVIDAVGISALINTSMELIKQCGKICCYGISPNLSMNLDWSKAPYNWKIDFVQWPSKLEEFEAHDEVMDYIENGVLAPSEFISDVFEFPEIFKAFEMIENKTTNMKTVIKFAD